ncbi:MAG: hypothetical protein JO263_11585 [Candidatus Eremiobacteraeota bacterium]|nr:hypothetical protein [Candidatus Eremiobacteraeota bacterium]
MTTCALAALATIALVGVQIVAPGKAPYHYGWYNVAIAALAAIVVLAGRGALRHAQSRSLRAAIAAGVFGCVVTGVAGIASGLFGPENQQVIGSPGQRVAVEGVGTLVFPATVSRRGDDANVQLARAMHPPAEISAGTRNLGSFVARATMRTVVEVEARDASGNRLTITQPMGRSFLSPVLLMEHRQTIAGFDVPFDSFNLPAARRIVKAVLFSPMQAAMFARGTGEPAVLFAIDDESDRPLPHGIAFDADGRSVRIAGLQLRATVGVFPAVELISAPNLVVTLVGAVLAIGATAFTVLQRWRARYGG